MQLSISPTVGCFPLQHNNLHLARLSILLHKSPFSFCQIFFHKINFSLGFAVRTVPFLRPRLLRRFSPGSEGKFPVHPQIPKYPSKTGFCNGLYLAIPINLPRTQHNPSIFTRDPPLTFRRGRRHGQRRDGAEAGLGTPPTTPSLLPSWPYLCSTSSPSPSPPIPILGFFLADSCRCPWASSSGQSRRWCRSSGMPIGRRKHH